MAQLCGSCLKEPPPYHRTIALFTYQPPIDGWILALKFHHKLIYAQLLGELLIQQLIASYHEEDWPELIIPVPLHRMRLVERGYNQTVEIAKVISKRLKIPLNRLDCQRVKATAPQLSLPAQQRQRNVKNAFILKRPLCMQHVAIVDDVVTTGSTAKELTRLLLNNGVQRVDVWCTARA
jgi:ComF family protein